MNTASHFETLTTRRVQIQEKAKRFVSDLRRLVLLLEADISSEEERAGIFDIKKPGYPDLARKLRTRRDNLLATIARLE